MFQKLKHIAERNKINPAKLSLLCITLPLFLLFMAFTYVPLLGWSVAFVDYKPGRSIFQSSFAGLFNFTKISYNMKEFIMVMRNTLVLGALGIAMTVVPLALAVLLNELRSKKYKRIVQTVASLPNFISWVIIYGLVFALFSVEGGVVNNILVKLGLMERSFDLLGSSSSVWGFQTGLSVWKTAGYSAIIYLGAIAGIDLEQYDAARVDGANMFREIRHITLPGILPTYAIILILSVGNILSSGFDQYYIFHNALTHETIEVLDTFTYRLGIERFDFSFATAVGMFKSVTSIILVSVSAFIVKKTTGMGIFSRN